MPFEKINGREIYYESHGHGETIVLLHHGFGCSKIWKNIYPGLVESGYRIIMYDRIGYGKSEKRKDFEEYYLSDAFCSECIKELAALREVLGFESFHIVGQCEGGVIGTKYAVEYPEQVKTVTTSSTQCYSKITMAEFNRLKFPSKFQELEPKLKEKFTDWHDIDHAESYYNLFAKYGGAYGIGCFDLRETLRLVTCPSLVLYPDRSALFDVDQAVAFYQSLPKGELAILPKCGHNTYDQRPREYVISILDFLERTRSAGTTSVNSDPQKITCLA